MFDIKEHGGHFKGKVGNGTDLNIFTQLEEPKIKEGIWIKTANKYKSIINDFKYYYPDTWKPSEIIDALSPRPFTYWTARATDNNRFIWYLYNGVIYEYDYLNDTYSVLPSLPAIAGFASMQNTTIAKVNNNKLLVIPGIGPMDTYHSDDMYFFDLSSRVWETVKKPFPASYLGFNVFDLFGKLNLIARNSWSDGSTFVTFAWYTYDYNTGTFTNLGLGISSLTNVGWTNVPQFPYLQSNSDVVYYVQGNASSFLRRLNYFDPKTLLVDGKIVIPSYNSQNLVTNTYVFPKTTGQNGTGYPTIVKDGCLYYVGCNAQTTPSELYFIKKDLDTGEEEILLTRKTDVINSYNVMIEPIDMGDSVYSLTPTKSTQNGVYTGTRVDIFSFVPSEYPEGTVILERRSEHLNRYYTQLFTTDKYQPDMFGRLLTSFQDVHYFTDGTLTKEPMYYGDGTQWVKFKN